VTEDAGVLEAPPSPALLTAPTTGQEPGQTVEEMPPAQVPVTLLPDRQPVSTGPIVTAGQVRLLATLQRRAGVTDEQIHSYLAEAYGITSRKEIRQGDLNAVLEWIDERRAMRQEHEAA
jgi:hypothetical protein